MPPHSLNPQSRTSVLPSSPLRLGTRSASTPFPPAGFFLPPPVNHPTSGTSSNPSISNPSSNPSLFNPSTSPPILPPQPTAPLPKRSTSVDDEERENTGRWTMEEHSLFLEGLRSHGKGWKQIAAMIQSRSVVQIRTHAQKYFQKLSKAQSQNGGNMVGEVFMDTRPTGTVDGSTSTATGIPPLSLLDLDTDMMGAQTKKNSSKNNRKPKPPKGNNLCSSSSSTNSSSPRRKRKIEAGELAAGLPSTQDNSNFASSSSNNRRQQTAGHGKRGGNGYHKSLDLSSSLSTTPGSVADPLLLGLDGLGVPSGWYGNGPHLDEGILSPEGMSQGLSIDPFDHGNSSFRDPQTFNQRNSRSSGGLSIPSHGFEGHLLDGLQSGDLDFFDVSDHVENHITSEESFANATGGLDDFSGSSDDNLQKRDVIGHSPSTESEGSSEEDVFYGKGFERASKQSNPGSMPSTTTTTNVRPCSIAMPIPAPPPVPPVLSHPMLSPCIAPVNGGIHNNNNNNNGCLLRPKSSNMVSWGNSRKSFTSTTQSPPPLATTQQSYIPTLKTHNANSTSMVANRNIPPPLSSLSKCTSFDSDMGPGFQESFTALDLHVFEDLDENEFVSEFLVDEENHF